MAHMELKDRKRGDYRYFLDYRLRWMDNDVYHHMNNNVYMFLIDSIVNQYLIDHCGRDPAISTEVGILVGSSCNFFRQIAYPNVVDCGLRVNHLGRTAATYEVGIFKQGSDEVCAVGGFTHVFCDKLSKDKFVPKKQGMCREVRENLEKLMVAREKAKL